MAARDIKDKESLERWLGGRSEEDARVIAARSVLRAIPCLELIAPLLGKAIWAPSLALAAMRVSHCAWSASLRRLPSPGAKSLQVYVDRIAEDLPIMDDFQPAINVVNAGLATVCIETDHVSDAAWATHYSSSALESFADSVNGATWDAILADSLHLENHRSTTAVEIGPLWPKGMPIGVANTWSALRTELLARSIEHWDMWIDWYEARLRGEPSNGEEEIARILEVTEEEWAAGPAIANKKIKDIVARFRSKPAETSAIMDNIATAAAKTTTIAPLFISHASQADGARARALAAALEAAGQPCWIAPRNIAPGADWNGSILAAIEACGGVVLLVSPASVSSPFVKAEIQHAFEHKKRVVPVRLAEAQPSLLDLRLKTIQHIEADGDFSLVVRAIVSL